MYKIIGSSRYGKEEIDEAETYEEAQALVDKYSNSIAYGDWRLYIQ